MRGSRLPQPPRGGGRPLPPEPPRDSDDAPPPLPSRPSHGGKPHGSVRLPPPPVVNGQSPESSDEEGQTYEEPDLPPPPPQSRHAPPPVPVEQETYDDLEDVQPEHFEEPGETYDECDMRPAPQQQQQQPTYEEEQCLYEEEPPSDDYPAPEPEGESDCLYEFMPETEETPPVPKPPPVSHNRPHIPLPPQPNAAPSLPARPPPSRPPDRDPSPESVPDDTDSSDTSESEANSFQSQISNARNFLKPKSSPQHNIPPLKPEPKVNIPADTSHLTIQQRIALMKGQPGGGSLVQNDHKPVPPIKPKVTPKPTPPVQSAKPQTPLKPVKQARNIQAHIGVANQSTTTKENIEKRTNVEKNQVTKPSEVKSPPPPVKSTPSPVKSPPPPIKQTAPVPAPSFEECDDIYDEGFSYVPDPLGVEEWYHGEIERSDTNSRLMSIGQDGTFLVRKSKQGGETQPYTLAVLFEGHVYNLKMRSRPDGQVALGEEKPDELAFKDVPALIQHHKNHDVILLNVKEKKQHKTLLKKHPINVGGK